MWLIRIGKEAGAPGPENEEVALQPRPPGLPCTLPVEPDAEGDDALGGRSRAVCVAGGGRVGVAGHTPG